MHRLAVAEVDQWARDRPTFGRSLDADAAAAGKFFLAERRLLAGLPAKPDRDPAQHDIAARVRGIGIAVRQEFVQAHVHALYEAVTGGRRLRLDEVVYAAAGRWPGLVPDRRLIDLERESRQADKEGYELDQAVLASQFLADPGIGGHLIRSMLRPLPAAVELLPAFRRTGHVVLDTVSVSRQGRAGVVTVHNGRYLNAEDDDVIADLEIAVDLVLLDDDIAVGVLRGGPMTHPRYAGRRVFSSGVNLTGLYHGQVSLLGFMLRRELGPMNKMLRGHWLDARPGVLDATREKPWIGVVDSFAIGGGMQMLLMLDSVLAEEGAYFRLPALIEGIVPGLGNMRLGKLLGSRGARRLILRGDVVRVSDPLGGLLCDRVLPAAELDAEIAATVETLASPAVLGNRRMLLESEEPLDAFRAYLAQYAWEQAQLLYGPTMVTNLERTWLSRPRRS